MAKVCKKCGRKIGFGEYSYNGECENCNKGISTNLTNNAKNTTNNDDTSGCIFGFIFIAIIIFNFVFLFVQMLLLIYCRNSKSNFF